MSPGVIKGQLEILIQRPNKQKKIGWGHGATKQFNSTYLNEPGLHSKKSWMRSPESVPERVP